jgi:predicted dehydrogenase
MFNWGIIGPGRIANKFAHSIEQVEDAQVYATASHNLEKAKAFAQKHSIVKAFDSYEKLVECEEIDAIYIATINPYHHQPAILCLNHKKPVLCEKPLTLNSEFAKQMIDTAKANNTFFMEAMWMWHILRSTN